MGLLGAGKVRRRGALHRTAGAGQGNGTGMGPLGEEEKVPEMRLVSRIWHRFHLAEVSLETAALPQTPKSERCTGDIPPLPSLSLASIKITNEVNINFFLPLVSVQNELHPQSPKVQRIIFQPFSQRASQ